MDASFTELAARLGAARKIDADDVLALRHEVYATGIVAREAAEVLIALDAATETRAAEWGDFFVQALVDLVVHQQDPADYVDEATAVWLTHAFTAIGRLKRDGAMEALARILDDATEVPADLAVFVLAKAKAWVEAQGSVSADGAELLRRVVYAGGGDGNLAVTRAEAEALFEIDAACRGANDPAWPDFFAKAVGACLTAVDAYRPESREGAMRDEAWLADREPVKDFLKGMAKKPDLGGALHEIFHPDADEAAEWAGAEAEIEKAEATAGQVSDDDAAWLKGLIARNGPPSEAVRRLTSFLRLGGDSAGDPPLIEAGLPEPRPEPQYAAIAAPIEAARPEPVAASAGGAPVFGHRQSRPA